MLECQILGCFCFTRAHQLNICYSFIGNLSEVCPFIIELPLCFLLGMALTLEKLNNVN